MKKNFAFTLAETLITLTIIGVVAALTIPTLMSKYQKHTYVVGLKKAYSQLSNAMKMMPLTEGCPAGDYDCVGIFENSSAISNIDNQNFENSRSEKMLYMLAKHIKYQTMCNKGKNTGICKLESKHGETNYRIWHYSAGKYFIANDGMLWGVEFYDTDEKMVFYKGFIFVDVNGKKGPNLNGRDTFGFRVATNTYGNIQQGTVIPLGSKLAENYFEIINPGYGYQHHWSTANASEQCTTSNLSINCTGRVLEEDAMNY